MHSNSDTEETHVLHISLRDLCLTSLVPWFQRNIKSLLVGFEDSITSESMRNHFDYSSVKVKAET